MTRSWELSRDISDPVKIYYRGEARELERLLKEQKEEKEREGNVLGAIGLGLLIAFVVGIIASLLSGGEE